MEERIQRIEHNLDLLAAAQEWEARMAARAEIHEKNFARIETNIAGNHRQAQRPDRVHGRF
jgi:hypothetical protein